MHFPFLEADPDQNADPSTRGAWTDEGLNAVQARNFVAGNEFSISDNDTWIQGPVFGAIQILAFKLFGSKLIVSRLIILLFSYLLLITAFFLAKEKFFPILFLFASLTELHVFQFSHFALPYILSYSLIITSIFILIKAIETPNIRKAYYNSITSAILIFLAFFSKFFFLYSLAIPIIVLVILIFVKRLNEEKKHLFRILGTYFIAIFVLFILYYLLWYKPHKSLFDFVVFGHIEALVPKNFSEISANIAQHFRGLIWGTHLRYFFLMFTICLPIAVYLIIKKKFENRHFIFLIISLVWFCIECNRFAMWYLPFRYILGFIISMILFISVVFSMVWLNYKKLRVIIITALAIIVYLNAKDYIQSYSNRTFTIKSANKYFSEQKLSGKTIIGPWAASLNWNSNAYILPVQFGSTSYKDILEQTKDIAIITENNQDDSNQAYQKLGLDLNLLSDSTKQFFIGGYDIQVFWLKNY